jgi:hypothetical protein
MRALRRCPISPRTYALASIITGQIDRVPELNSRSTAHASRPQPLDSFLGHQGGVGWFGEEEDLGQKSTIKHEPLTATKVEEVVVKQEARRLFLCGKVQRIRVTGMTQTRSHVT